MQVKQEDGCLFDQMMTAEGQKKKRTEKSVTGKEVPKVGYYEVRKSRMFGQELVQTVDQ